MVIRTYCIQMHECQESVVDWLVLANVDTVCVNFNRDGWKRQWTFRTDIRAVGRAMGGRIRPMKFQNTLPQHTDTHTTSMAEEACRGWLCSAPLACNGAENSCCCHHPNPRAHPVTCIARQACRRVALCSIASRWSRTQLLPPPLPPDSSSAWEVGEQVEEATCSTAKYLSSPLCTIMGRTETSAC